MPKSAPVAVLNLGANGQVTIPAEFRKEHGLAGGAKVIAVRMGNALVMAPHDGVLESICMRLEEAMKGAGVSVEELKAQALRERAQMVRERFGAPHRAGRKRRR